MGLKLATDLDLNIPHLTKENKKKLKILQDEVIRNNLNFNLISKSSELNIWNRHIIDSAQLLNFFPKELKSFIDIGSGAGFPGLVIKILNTSLEGHLVESNSKKANFLKNISKKIGVDINIHNERFENLHNLKNDNSYILTSRAVSSLNNLLKLTVPFFDTGSIGLFHKGEKWEIEINEAKKFWSFEFEAIKSLTNKKSRIIMIKNVIRK